MGNKIGAPELRGDRPSSQTSDISRITDPTQADNSLVRYQYSGGRNATECLPENSNCSGGKTSF